MDTKDAEMFWDSLERDAEGCCDADSFVTILAEQWDCPDPIINLILRELIRTDGRDGRKVVKDKFLNFARTFGPWPKEGCSSPNPMLGLIMRDFFDESKKQVKQNFHGYLDEKSAYKLLKAPGEYLYRYSSGRPGCIAVSRTSTTKKDGKLQHTTDLLANTGSGSWQHLMSKVVFASLSDFETKHKEKLLRLVCNVQDQAHVGNYGTFLMAEDDGAKPDSYAAAFA
jgi:hypothetical protein